MGQAGAKNVSDARNFASLGSIHKSMNPTKPAAVSAQAHAPQTKAQTALQVPLMLKGPAFVNVLGAMPMPTPKPPQIPQTAQGCKMQTSLPQAVAPVRPDQEKRHRAGPGDELDPSMRQSAQLAPPMTTAVATEAEKEQVAAQTNARVSLEDLVPELVKKIAWSGDSRRGTVRMELGAGDLAGSTLTVSASDGRVSVDVVAPPGTDVGAWREKIASRLAARGLSLESVEVH